LSGGSEQSLAGTIFGFGRQAREGRITEIEVPYRGHTRGHMLVSAIATCGRDWRVGTYMGEQNISAAANHARTSRLRITSMCPQVWLDMEAVYFCDATFACLFAKAKYCSGQ